MFPRGVCGVCEAGCKQSIAFCGELHEQLVPSLSIDRMSFAEWARAM